MVAQSEHHCVLVEALLERGARTDAANKSGITALISAAFYGHKPVVVKLLQRGANARLVDAKKRAALHWAALNNNDAVQPWLSNPFWWGSLDRVLFLALRARARILQIFSSVCGLQQPE